MRCSGVFVAAQSRAMLPVFCGISGSTRAILIMLTKFHSHPPVIVLETHDVIFAEIITELNFDDFQYICPAVTNAVIGGYRDMNVLALAKPQFVISANNIGNTLNYDPVFVSALVALKTESGTRVYF